MLDYLKEVLKDDKAYLLPEVANLVPKVFNGTFWYIGKYRFSTTPAIEEDYVFCDPLISLGNAKWWSIEDTDKLLTQLERWNRYNISWGFICNASVDDYVPFWAELCGFNIYKLTVSHDKNNEYCGQQLIFITNYQQEV